MAARQDWGIFGSPQDVFLFGCLTSYGECLYSSSSIVNAESQETTTTSQHVYTVTILGTGFVTLSYSDGTSVTVPQSDWADLNKQVTLKHIFATGVARHLDLTKLEWQAKEFAYHAPSKSTLGQFLASNKLFIDAGLGQRHAKELPGEGNIRDFRSKTGKHLEIAGRRLSLQVVFREDSPFVHMDLDRYNPAQSPGDFFLHGLIDWKKPIFK
jgi:hypothetical protein